MRMLLQALFLGGVVTLLSGCSGSEADKGVNKDKDRPKATDKAAQ